MHRRELSPEEQAEATREAYRALTKREREVLGEMLGGKSAKQIAGVLEISFRTVELHRSRILIKFNASNTVRLVVAVGRYMPELLNSYGGG